MIDIGTVENARELVFTPDPKSDHRYILQSPETRTDYLELLNRFPQNQVRRTTEFYIEDTDGAWFAVFNVDCFDPPFAIIRARSFEAAYEVFCDEFERWIKVEDSDAGDYPEEDRNYNSSGTHIDTDNVQLLPLTLLRVEVGA